MSQPRRAPPAQETALAVRLQSFGADIPRYVQWVWPWGKANTPLAQHDGPRQWQLEQMQEIAEHIVENQRRMARGELPKAYQGATASGRGIGKSAEFGMLSHWMQSVNLGSTVTVTANTQNQLQTKTFPELRKWFTMAINAHWFDVQALSINYQEWFAKLLMEQLSIDPAYSGVKAQLWDGDNPDAFAGTHNMLGVMLLMDEASGIPTSIYDVCPGFFTEPVLHRYWMAFGNPRRTTGGFYESFAPDSPWIKRNIDARTVPGDHAMLEQIIDKYGADSDKARVEVRGLFPRTGQDQFIARDVIDAAVQREVEYDSGAPLIAGGDPARLGGDDAVLRFRCGRDGARRVPPPVRSNGLDNMKLAELWAEQFDLHKPDAIFIDAGNGTGVIDILRSRNYRVTEVWFGATSSDPAYHDNRSRIWGEMGEWCKTGAIDQDLADDLYDPLQVAEDSEPSRLESKKAMRRRGLPSPDDGDAFACTFAGPVSRRDAAHSRNRGGVRIARGTNYNPLDPNRGEMGRPKKSPLRAGNAYRFR